jgi:hypothetical protein
LLAPEAVEIALPTLLAQGTIAVATLDTARPVSLGKDNASARTIRTAESRRQGAPVTIVSMLTAARSPGRTPAHASTSLSAKTAQHLRLAKRVRDLHPRTLSAPRAPATNSAAAHTSSVAGRLTAASAQRHCRHVLRGTSARRMSAGSSKSGVARQSTAVSALACRPRPAPVSAG